MNNTVVTSKCSLHGSAQRESALAALTAPVNQAEALKCFTSATRIIPNFIQDSPELMQQLLKDSSWTDMKSRSFASYGVSYQGLKSYAIDGNNLISPPMPANLVQICQKIQQQFGFLPNNCLLNYYKDRNSKIGFHADSIKEMAHGTGVVIISLGAERELTFRHVRDHNITRTVALKDGSLFYMTRDMQNDWQHAILATQAKAEARMSLTFRLLPASVN